MSAFEIIIVSLIIGKLILLIVAGALDHKALQKEIKKQDKIFRFRKK